MRLRWYLCSLILSFALFGAIQHYGTQEPNQELILQFDETTSHLEIYQQYIASIEKTLSNFEVEDVKIYSKSDGFYRITYSSNEAISRIKDALSFLETISENSDSNEDNVNFDIFEIKAKPQNQWDFEGQLVHTANPKSDRFSEVKLLKYLGNIQNEKASISLNKIKAIDLQRSFSLRSYSIGSLEIRAGPLS